MKLLKLKDPELLVIFTTASAGLGHIRVTDALQEGLPEEVNDFILSSHDVRLTLLHRISSINPFFRRMQYFVQYHPVMGSLFAKIYRFWQRRHTGDIDNQLTSILNIHRSTPKTLVVVATHFGLAYKIAAIKDNLSRSSGIKIQLYVLVTDDSYQEIWAVDGADYLTVPSEITKLKYEQYFKGRKKAPIVLVHPYPVALKFAGIDKEVLTLRKKQVSMKSKIATQIVIPISGAAVQLDFFEKIIPRLCQKKKSFEVTVVAKKTPFVRPFLNLLSSMKNLRLVTGMTDREVVDLYEGVYLGKEAPVIEITKPSEQAFKVLFEPRQFGGSIMFFTKPVGKQEDDNLDFLMRHKVMPGAIEAMALERMLLSKEMELPAEILEKARSWRALNLPNEDKAAAIFINNARKSGLLAAMLEYHRPIDSDLLPDGVSKFWELVDRNL